MIFSILYTGNEKNSQRKLLAIATLQSETEISMNFRQTKPHHPPIRMQVNYLIKVKQKQ